MMKYIICIYCLLSSVLINSFSYQNILESSLNNYNISLTDNFDWDHDSDLEDEDEFEENDISSLLWFDFREYVISPNVRQYSLLRMKRSTGRPIHNPKDIEIPPDPHFIFC